jgi:hypothetical protein
MEKLRIAKSAFEHASADGSEAAATAKKTAVGLAYLSEALMDMAAELLEVKALLNKARKDMNETSHRTRNTTESQNRAEPNSPGLSNAGH